jgi:3-hydroxyisobutyrate dehydrogenase-like beta-hydroxyacid dehydrogenase
MAKTTSSHDPHTDVTVVGLGPMGAALARAFMSAGLRTTVWNRTRSRAEALVPAGAYVATDLASAIRAADLVVTCLRDHDTTRQLLGSLPAEAFAGRTLVVLASSTPDDARETQAWADSRGITILIGAIMVPTPLIGSPHALIIYAGREELLAQNRAALVVLAPRSEFVGDDPGSAALLDTAMLEVFFAGMTAFLHAAALVTGQGMTSSGFLPWAKEMLAILPETLSGLAEAVDAGTHPGGEDNLAMELAALSHIVGTSRDARLDSRLPELMHDLARQAVEQGHGADGWSRVVEILRHPQDRPAIRD